MNNKLIEMIDQAMPPGSDMEVTLENFQNIASALYKVRCHLASERFYKMSEGDWVVLRCIMKGGFSNTQRWALDWLIAKYSNTLVRECILEILREEP
jgi:hypothetical protein